MRILKGTQPLLRSRSWRKGYTRLLTGLGHDSVVHGTIAEVAPSLIPMKAGDRVLLTVAHKSSTSHWMSARRPGSAARLTQS
jgi:hypothetical protein